MVVAGLVVVVVVVVAGLVVVVVAVAGLVVVVVVEEDKIEQNGFSRLTGDIQKKYRYLNLSDRQNLIVYQ